MVQIWVWKCKVTTSNLICCERFSRLEYHWFILNNYFKDLFFIKPSSDYFFCWSNPQPEIDVLTPTWFDAHSLCMRAAEPQSCWFPDCIAGECLWEYHRARAGNRPRFGNYTLARSLKRCILSLLSPSERFFFVMWGFTDYYCGDKRRFHRFSFMKTAYLWALCVAFNRFISANVSVSLFSCRLLFTLPTLSYFSYIVSK